MPVQAEASHRHDFRRCLRAQYTYDIAKPSALSSGLRRRSRCERGEARFEMPLMPTPRRTLLSPAAVLRRVHFDLLYVVRPRGGQAQP